MSPSTAHRYGLAGPLLALLLLLPHAAPAAEEPRPPSRPPLDFRVLKVGEPLTGLWECANPAGGDRLRIDIRAKEGEKGAYVGTLVSSGTVVLEVSPKSEGIGYHGEMLHLLAGCGEDRSSITDFVPVGNRALVQVETKPPAAACPFLEAPGTARWFIAPSENPVRLRGIGEMTSEKTREQIGLAGQPGGPSTPILGDSVSVESGSEMRFRGRVRSLDGTMWIEVEGMVSPAAGVEAPRGYLLPESLRIAATLTLERPKPAAPPASN